MTKANSNRAKFSGTCQLCGHFQKLPNDRLSLHGYTVRWNCFVGDCPGSRGLPFEVSIDLIEGAIARQISYAKELRANAPKVRASRDPKNVSVRVYASDVRRVDDGKRAPGLFGDESSAKIVGDLAKTEAGIDFRFTRNGTEYRYAMNVYGSVNLDDFVAELRGKQADALLAQAKNCDEYVAWQRGRIAGWKAQPEKLVPVDAADYAPTLHAIGSYWTKREGRPIALCVSSIRSAGYKTTTTERAKVTCAACLKRLAAADVAAIESTKANELIAEMIAKHGERVTIQFSDANEKAIKELRYNRKEIDKGVRKLATDRLERGIK
jgi:hypothetical protein